MLRFKIFTIALLIAVSFLLLAFPSKASEEHRRGDIEVLVFAPKEIGEEISKVVRADHPLLKLFKPNVKSVSKMDDFVTALQEKPTVIIAPVTSMEIISSTVELIPADDLIKSFGDVAEAAYKADTDKDMREACSENGKQLCFPLFAHTYLLITEGEEPLSERPTLKELMRSGLKVTSLFSPGELSLIYLSPLFSSDPLRGYVYWQLAKVGKYKVALLPAYVIPSISFKDVPPSLSLYPIEVERGVLNSVPFNLYGVFVGKPRPELKDKIRKYGERTYRSALRKVLSRIISFETQKELALKFQVVPANKQVRLYPSYIKMVRDPEEKNILWANNLAYHKKKLLPDERIREAHRELLKAMLKSLKENKKEYFSQALEGIAWKVLEPHRYAKRIERAEKNLYAFQVLSKDGEGKWTREAFIRSSEDKSPYLKGLYLALRLIDEEVNGKEDLKKEITLEFPKASTSAEKSSSTRSKGKREEEKKMVKVRVRLGEVLTALLVNDPAYLVAVKNYLKLKEVPYSLEEIVNLLQEKESLKEKVEKVWGVRLELGDDEASNKLEEALPWIYADLINKNLSFLWVRLVLRGKELEYLYISVKGSLPKEVKKR